MWPQQVGQLVRFQVAKQFDEKHAELTKQYYPTWTRFHGKLEIFEIEKYSNFSRRGSYSFANIGKWIFGTKTDNNNNNSSNNESKTSNHSNASETKSNNNDDDKNVQTTQNTDDPSDADIDMNSKDSHDAPPMPPNNNNNNNNGNIAPQAEDAIEAEFDDFVITDYFDSDFQVIDNDPNASNRHNNADNQNNPDNLENRKQDDVKCDETNDVEMGQNDNNANNSRNKPKNCKNTKNAAKTANNGRNGRNAIASRGVKTPDFPVILDNCVFLELDLAKFLVESKLFDNGKWVESELYLHGQCVYVKYNHKQWFYLPKHHFQFLPHPEDKRSRDKKHCYFYWMDRNGFIVMARIDKQQVATFQKRKLSQKHQTVPIAPKPAPHAPHAPHAPNVSHAPIAPNVPDAANGANAAAGPVAANTGSNGSNSRSYRFGDLTKRMLGLNTNNSSSSSSNNENESKHNNNNNAFACVADAPVAPEADEKVDGATGDFVDIYNKWLDEEARVLPSQTRELDGLDAMKGLHGNGSDARRHMIFNRIRREFCLTTCAKHWHEYGSSMYNVKHPIWHRNEFAYDLKCHLIDNVEDVRDRDEDALYPKQSKDAVTHCMFYSHHEFGLTKYIKKYECSWCHKIGCSECVKYELINPATQEKEWCCVECSNFYQIYFKMPAVDAVDVLDKGDQSAGASDEKKDCNQQDGNSKQPRADWSVNDILGHYGNVPKQRRRFKEIKWGLVQEAVLLCHWIYQPFQNDTLLRSLGFKKYYFVAANEQNKIQYSIVRSLLNPNTYYLVFRGSYDFLDWLTNAGALPLYIPELGFKVHHGMYTALQLYAFEAITRQVLSIVEKHARDPEVNLIVCGHSLGGGYALLTAAYLLANSLFAAENNNLQVVTFAAPMSIADDACASAGASSSSKSSNSNSSSCSNISGVGGVGGSRRNVNTTLWQLNEVTINFIYQFDIVPRLQIGMSYNYLTQFIKHMASEYVPSWVHVVDTLLNGRLSGSVSSFLGSKDVKALASVQKSSYLPIGEFCLLFDHEMGVSDLSEKMSDFSGVNCGLDDLKARKDEPVWLGMQTSLYVRELYGSYLFMEENENVFGVGMNGNERKPGGMTINQLLQLLPKRNGQFPSQMIEEHWIVHYLAKIMFLTDWKQK